MKEYVSYLNTIWYDHKYQPNNLWSEQLEIIIVSLYRGGQVLQ